jgi:hypothetical protein
LYIQEQLLKTNFRAKKKARNNHERKRGLLLTSYPSNEQLSQQLQLEMVGHVLKVEDDLKLFDVDLHYKSQALKDVKMN